MGVCKQKPRDCKCKRCTDGWWSRRHPTREAKDAARERYGREHGTAVRRRKAQERAVSARETTT